MLAGRASRRSKVLRPERSTSEASSVKASPRPFGTNSVDVVPLRLAPMAPRAQWRSRAMGRAVPQPRRGVPRTAPSAVASPREPPVLLRRTGSGAVAARLPRSRSKASRIRRTNRRRSEGLVRRRPAGNPPLCVRTRAARALRTSMLSRRAADRLPIGALARGRIAGRAVKAPPMAATEMPKADPAPARRAHPTHAARRTDSLPSAFAKQGCSRLA